MKNYAIVYCYYTKFYSPFTYLCARGITFFNLLQRSTVCNISSFSSNDVDTKAAHRSINWVFDMESKAFYKNKYIIELTFK